MRLSKTRPRPLAALFALAALVSVAAVGCSSGTTKPGRFDSGLTIPEASADKGVVVRDTYVWPDQSRDVDRDSGGGTLDGKPDTTVDSTVDTGPPKNDKCQNATPLTWSGGVAKTTGDTSVLKDEFPQLKCGGGFTLDGPQAYYKISLKAGQSYEIRLRPTFDAFAYVFGASAKCVEADIEKECGSGGKEGDLSAPIGKNTVKSFFFKPTKDGDYIIGVDSTNAGDSGSFELTVVLDCSYLTDECNGGVVQNDDTCVKQPSTDPCDDKDPCTDNDTCSGGKCVGTPKNCTAAADQCNDGVCMAGQCVKQPKTGSCSDGNPCTDNDTCQNGTCQGTQKDCSSVADQCNTGGCVNGTCQKLPKTGGCNDNDPCTDNDTCTGGSCLGTAKDCSHRADQCNTPGCYFGACVAYPKTGVGCNDNNICTNNDKCSGTGVCRGTPIVDGYESNDSRPGRNITNTSDCDNLSYSLTASIYPSGDNDWYRFFVSDNTGCDVEPKVRVEMPSGVNYQLCVYFKCNNGSNVDLSCLTGTWVSGPTSGTAGCCSWNSGSAADEVRLSPSCSWLGTGDESGWLDVRVYSSSGATCTSYTLRWGDS